MTHLGPTQYIITGHYHGMGLSPIGEDVRNFDDAVSEVIQWLDPLHTQFRAIRLDFDAETDALECSREVTEEVMDAVAEWHAERGRLCPAMNDRDAEQYPDPMGAAYDRARDRMQAGWAAE